MEFYSSKYDDLPDELFTKAQSTQTITDLPLSTKPSSYFKDALIRFSKDKGSVICFFIIVFLVLYAIFGPLFSIYKISDKDGYYAFASPKSKIFSFAGWDGCYIQEVNQQTYDYLYAIPGAIKKDYGIIQNKNSSKQKWYKVKIDSYAKVGYIKKLLTPNELQEAVEWEKSNKQIFYPLINEKLIKNSSYKSDQNAWFLTDSKGNAKKSNGNFIPIYIEDESTEDGFKYFLPKMNGTQIETRILYSSWYEYKNGHEASFLFGADNAGYDIWTRLAHGARLSLFLSILVASINLFLGIIIGSIEGYYGGTIDLIIERIKDILYQIPTVILMTLFQLYFAKKVGPIVSMFIAFIFFGWIGSSSTVRAQFYRFKGQEYVMASRTLGAKDSRLIFKHILPNSIGFIITSSVLSIPAVIFSEANLTYLGIVNLQSDTMTSVGTMLNTAQSTLSTHPHCVFFPAVFISILLVCFNTFGNGLRDAFNPALRGNN